MKKIRLLILLVLLFASLGLLVGENITGVWTCDYVLFGDDITDYFEFYEDGSGLWYDNWDNSSTFTWEIAGDELWIIWKGDTEVDIYDIEFNKDGSFTIGADYGDGYEEWTYEQIED